MVLEQDECKVQGDILYTLYDMLYGRTVVLTTIAGVLSRQSSIWVGSVSVLGLDGFSTVYF